MTNPNRFHVQLFSRVDDGLNFEPSKNCHMLWLWCGGKVAALVEYQEEPRLCCAWWAVNGLKHVLTQVPDEDGNLALWDTPEEACWDLMRNKTSNSKRWNLG